MTGHLTEEAILRLLDGEADVRTRAHAEACSVCQGRLREVEGGLALAREGSEVPEPSPLYWESFRRQVEERIAQEPAPLGGWRRYFGIATLVPAAAAVALLVAVIPWREVRAPALESREVLPAWEALPKAQDDAGLLVLEGLALRGSDLETAVVCRGVVECLYSLSEEESLAVANGLRDALEARS